MWPYGRYGDEVCGLLVTLVHIFVGFDDSHHSSSCVRQTVSPRVRSRDPRGRGRYEAAASGPWRWRGLDSPRICRFLGASQEIVVVDGRDSYRDPVEA